MKREEWVDGEGPGATLEISVVPPVVYSGAPRQGAVCGDRIRAAALEIRGASTGESVHTTASNEAAGGGRYA